MAITNGKILFELPEVLSEPKIVENFFTEEMLSRVKSSIVNTKIGTDQSYFHTMQARWLELIGFDSDIEEFIIKKARIIFNDEFLEKSYFFAAKYQRKDGCTPHLWEHLDTNGTQTTIDITIENTANWGIVVEGEYFEQKPNNAIVFCGQQHLHSRPPYPTNNETLFTTVLFLHFTHPEHWVQKDKSKINTYASDGYIRFFNRNRYFPLPDGPINQPVCECCNFSGVLNFYHEIVGNKTNELSETTDMPIISKTELAPGIIKFAIPKESARTLKGLIQNAMFRQWEQSKVLGNDGVASYDDSLRKCFQYSITDKQFECHPQDPIRRAAESLNNGFDMVIDDFASRYGIHHPLSSNHTLLLRYEEGGMFCNHIDENPYSTRVVSLSMFLNDDYEGGELEFKEFNLRIKPVSGEIVVFSSGFPYMHQVLPVTMGIRYSVVKWYEFSKNYA